MCFKVKMPEVKLTGRDVLPETQSQTPDSPHFGDDFTEAARRRGKESLMIQKNDTSNTYRPTNF